MTEYEKFLEGKKIAAISSGFELPKERMNPMLFDWQKDVVYWALKKGRAALFEECGLGKSGQSIQWAEAVSEHSGKPVLIVCPLAVADQFRREALKFGFREITVCRNQRHVKSGVNVTNYEMLEHFDISEFGGVVLDESSILKSYTGKMKRMIVDTFKAAPYRLACSATPAPNDLMELLNQAEFLGVMKSSEALSCWFITDFESGHYRLKGHAEKDFWRWVSSWAVCIDKPSDIGYSDEGYILPPMGEITVTVKPEEDDPFAAIREGMSMNATSYHAEKRKTIMQRAEETAKIVASSNEQFVVWCYQNDEADVLKRLIPEAVEIRGSDKPETKEKAAIDFVNGKTRVLISKPSIFGMGLNFQQCSKMVFCGMDYSFESYYQAVRRVWRFGQDKPVTVWRVIGTNETVILDTVERKARQKKDMSIGMAQAVKEFQTGEIHGKQFKLNMERQTTDFPSWLRSEKSA